MNNLIAEVGSVHDGSFGNALRLIHLAKYCGATAVKFQTHIAAEETIVDAPSPHYFSTEPRYQYFERTSFTLDQLHKLRTESQKIGISFISSPFSILAASLLADLHVDYIKIPSGEVTNIPLIEYISNLGIPTILSTGMSNWIEIDSAVSVLKNKVPLTVLQCTSLYPCPPSQVGLNILEELRLRYGPDISVGLSDHTDTMTAGPAAAVLGATTIEKHLTFSRMMYGSDAPNAMEPDKFSLYASMVREAWQMSISPVDKDDISPFLDMKHVFEKSIVSKHSLPAGHRLTFDDLSFKKPSIGFSPSMYTILIDRILAKPIPQDHFFTEDDLQ